MGLLRFLLAVSVVLSHSGGFFYYNMVGPEVAVLTFFMISGFLMQLILTSKYDPVSEKSLFWSNRFLRIYPLYLVAIVFALSLNLIFLSIGSDYFDLLVQRAPYLDAGDWALLIGTQVSIVGQEIFLFMAQGDSGLVLSATGIDSRVWQLVILPPAWSLSIELMFYIAVPYLARLGEHPARNDRGRRLPAESDPGRIRAFQRSVVLPVLSDRAAIFHSGHAFVQAKRPCSPRAWRSDGAERS